MDTIPVFGTYGSVTFFKDDTIEIVRQHLALLLETHPDRMFVECRTSLPANYYSSNPKNWTDLFFRMSRDGEKITAETLKTYLNQVRVGTGVVGREVSKEEWEAKTEYLEPLFNSEFDFEEWRLFGVEEAKSTILPLPPQEIPLSVANIPILKPQSVFEVLHPLKILEFRVTIVPEGASEVLKRVYYPLLRPDTASNIENIRESFERTQAHYKKLIELDVPKHETMSIVKAKWYIPFVSTQITAPRARFEQIFYGLTVSTRTPHIAYFTAKTETVRHKFYVEDPKNKKPWLDSTLFNHWFMTTQPQRRKPTLLLYRGKTKTSFDRIAITDKDIIIDIRREKGSKDSLEELQAYALEWLQTLDAVQPFIVQTDLEQSRWELSEMSLVAGYAKDIAEFDMHRFPCLQTIFGVQNDTFRLLRAEHTSEDISPREMQAYQILSTEGAERNPQYLAEEMRISLEEAVDLFESVTSLATDLNLEKTLKSYPTLKFTNKEVLIKFATNPERTLKYADILRHVLTSESEAVNDVCPRRMEEVAPVVAVPQQEINVEEETDEDLLAALGITEAPEEEPVSSAAPSTTKPSRKVKVASKTMATYNHFNNRLKAFDPNTFDQSFYPKKCEKPQQVIALTPEDKTRIGPKYNYEDAPESEKLELSDPDATVICPPYWCMRDEIPLREEQLITKDDGELHCPVCDGKVRTSDNADPVQFTVIRRDTLAKYPDYMKKNSTINDRKVPCCYKQERSGVVEVLSDKENESFILKEDVKVLPGFRMAYLSETLQSQLKVKSHYETSIKKGRLASGEKDFFRIGLDSPTNTLPVMLKDTKEIKRPSEARENVLKCSFFRNWRKTGEGGDEISRTIASIDEAYVNGELSIHEEVEYVTTFLECNVMLINVETGQLECGFWTDTKSARSRTIVLLGNDILGQVTRKKVGKAYKNDYIVNIQDKEFGKDLAPLLTRLNNEACASSLPNLQNALNELPGSVLSDYNMIVDPFNKVQAIFVPKKYILPIQPVGAVHSRKAKILKGYKDIEKDDLPIGKEFREFLKNTKHPGFKIVEELQDVTGQIVEFRLASGFRAPIQPETPTLVQPAKEVLATLRRYDEKDLVDGKPNAKDLKDSQETSYGEEIYEFMMYSLSKDIQTIEYEHIRQEIEKKSKDLYRDLVEWYKREAYEDTTVSPLHFINKVRTPCGQFKNEEACKKSSLCGWHEGTCKIRVKPYVNTEKVLNRMAKTLLTNEKQRALVLDDRISPFFSTILYLEMPHELITTNI
jgi:hypothetical protein